MTPETSPFQPGRPVPVELFVGRHEAIERLCGLVRTANRGKFRIGFITGERGIGIERGGGGIGSSTSV